MAVLFDLLVAVQCGYQLRVQGIDPSARHLLYGGPQLAQVLH
jgi:hypothetical protein